MIFYETLPGQHTTDSALSNALSWLNRTPGGMVDTILLTLPGPLRRDQMRSLFAELYRVLSSNHGALWLWGRCGDVAGHGFSTHSYGELTRAWTSWDIPVPSDQPFPMIEVFTREMPPSVTDYCLRSSARAQSLIVEIFPRAPHISRTIADELGATLLQLAPVTDLYTADHTAPPFVRDRFFHDHFFNMLKPQGNCLIYPGTPHKSGYGRMRFHGVEYYAHHVSWMLSHRRAIPPGIPVLHASCPDRRCCRPDHLRLGTTSVNLDERWLGRRVAK